MNRPAKPARANAVRQAKRVLVKQIGARQAKKLLRHARNSR